MSAIGAIKAEMAECERRREEVAPLLDKAHDRLKRAKGEFEQHQDRVLNLSDRIERLTEALRILEDR